MKLSDFRTKLNTTLLEPVGAGNKTIILTSHGFPVAQVTAINKPPPPSVTEGNDTWAQWLAMQGALPGVATSGYITPAPGTWPAGSWKGTSTVDVDPNVVIPSTTNTAPVVTNTTPDPLTHAADGRPFLDPVPEPESGQPIQWHAPKVTVGEFKQAEAVADYKIPLKECSLEMLETALSNTELDDVQGRAELMHFIREQRPFDATETEIYRQLMDQLKPDISGKYDGT